MSKTTENLQAAFAGESQANRRYLAFAKKAESEGNLGIAKLFRAAAEGETIHALRHLQTLGEVKDTAENLKAAVAGETYEIDMMYPEFLTQAQAENEKGAEASFSQALKVEMIHQALFQKALQKLEAGEDLSDVDYYICPVCGYPAILEVPDFCPVCQTPKAKFQKN
ncbi:MAG: rubrerythrin family protein [Parcubacteria group bacterium]|jgi:rubrerythrin